MRPAARTPDWLPAGFWLVEDPDVIELRCAAHGPIAHFSAAGAIRAEIEAECLQHLQKTHSRRFPPSGGP